jgi:predicted lipid-binding transport protein (Tim44 family)
MTPADQPLTAHPAPAAGQGGESLLDLVGQLTSQGSHLAEQQLHLIQAEIRESAADVKTAVGGLLGAAVVGIAGLGVVLMGLAYLLADIIDNTWLATLIVGVVTLVLAFILYKVASNKMSAAHLAPDRTRRTLERTPDAARGELTEPTP